MEGMESTNGIRLKISPWLEFAESSLEGDKFSFKWEVCSFGDFPGYK